MATNLLPQTHAMPAAAMLDRPPAPTAPAVTARAEGHLFWMDWLRFLAAALVLVDHTRMLNWSKWTTLEGSRHVVAMNVFFSVTQLGRQAVVVFFVLSGLLVGGKTLARVRAGTFDAASYAADRLSRVYVPLVPALLLTAAVVRAYDAPLHPVDFLGSLFSVQGVLTDKPPLNTPLWTLAYEVWFYVLAGCAAAACVRRLKPIRRLVAGAGALLALGVLLVPLDAAYLICWLLGASGLALRGRIKRGRGFFAVVGAAAAAAGVVLYQMDLGILPQASDAWEPWMPTLDLAQVIVAAGATLCVACLIQMRPATRAVAWVEQQGTRLAAFSYTLYLTHLPVLYLIAGSSRRMPPEVNGASVGRALWWMAETVAAALVMYALFEARTLPVRRWLRARFAGTRGEPARAGLAHGRVAQPAAP